MSWLKKIFGIDKAPENAEVNPSPIPAAQEEASVAPERIGLNGEYDQSGLAKRVALAYDQDPELAPHSEDTVWVAQTGTAVVLRGKVPDQGVLDRLVDVALTVNGATEVLTNEVTVG